MKLLISIFIVLNSTITFACPLGAKEDHLTIQRVMRNFGRFVLQADMISVRSQNTAEVITDAQLEEAILKLSSVLSCAQAVIDNPTGDLVPVHVRGWTGEPLDKYIEDLVFYLGEFQLSIEEYQNLFIKEIAKDKKDRSFAAIQKHMKRQDALIDRAHSLLM